MSTEYNLLPLTHFGRRPGSSPENALYYLLEKTFSGWNRRKVSTALFLDVSGAFDNVSHECLIHNLKKQKIVPQIVSWIQSFLSGRSTIVRTNEFTTKTLQVGTGIPQGSPLSPILYLFYNADLIENCALADVNLDVSGFIDDRALLATGDTTEENCLLLEKAHEICTAWADTHGSKFALAKYQLIHFTRKRKADILILKDHSITPSISCRYLGIQLDRKLLWNEHLKDLKSKAIKSIGALSSLSSSTWEGNILSLRRLYLSVIIPQITFCCSVWYCPADQKEHKKSHLQTLESLQGKAARVISGAFRATSLPVLNVETLIPPIDLQLQKLNRLTTAQISSFPLNKLYLESRLGKKRHKLNPLESLQEEYQNQPGSDFFKNERICLFTTFPWWIPPYILINSCKNTAKIEHENFLRTSHITDVLFYTDGSGINNKIGASAYLLGLDQTFKLYLGFQGYYTVYKGELTGILMAL